MIEFKCYIVDCERVANLWPRDSREISYGKLALHFPHFSHYR